jgi:surface polysaccharide O-acyltransferase-like enzyme
MSLTTNDHLSRKLKVMSLAAIILVVFIHSYNEDVKFASDDLTGEPSLSVLFIENFFSKGIARIAAPFFFAISGFLFYQHYDFTLSVVVEKFKKRFKSLLIPYLFWSVSGLFFIWCLQLIPWTRVFFTRELIANYSFSRVLFTIFVDPVPYQLWFVRDLILLVIFSPLIWYLTKSIRGVWLLILMLLWNVSGKTFEFFSNEALLFFTIGCALALDETELINRKLSKISCYSLLVSWLWIVLLTTYIITFDEDVFGLNILSNLGILLGILSTWFLYDHIDHGQLTKYSFLFGSTFFIFAFHEPLLTILKKGMFFLLGRTNLTSILIYVVAPVVAIVVSMVLSLVLKRYTPRFYSFATGGR